MEVRNSDSTYWPKTNLGKEVKKPLAAKIKEEIKQRAKIVEQGRDVKK